MSCNNKLFSAVTTNSDKAYKESGKSVKILLDVNLSSLYFATTFWVMQVLFVQH